MSDTSRRRSKPPRLVVRTMAAIFATVGLVLFAVFVLIVFDVRERVNDAVTARLVGGQRLFSALESRRQRELLGQVGILAESPTLKAALDTYATERQGGRAEVAQLRRTVQRELEKLGQQFDADVLAIADVAGQIVAATGNSSHVWRVGTELLAGGPSPDAGGADMVLTLRDGWFRALRVPLWVGTSLIGDLYVATAVDHDYVAGLAEVSGADTIAVHAGGVIASTLERRLTDAFAAIAGGGPVGEDVIRLGGEAYAIRLLFRAGPAEFYALTSIDRAAAVPLREALVRLAGIAAGAVLLIGVASLALARTISRPIDDLTRTIVEMRRRGSLDGRVTANGSSRELEALASTFNGLMETVGAAHEQTRAASVGAIKALATALDARDPYTAGHSERVSALSVAVGRELRLPAEDLEILRLGALLHDIGKIGISDAVLRKPGPLTDAEFESIKRHPGLGAHILGPVPFLSPHLPIVELHHEQPDGRGYPHGLVGDEIPLLARIVHVADAFDAMTSARAYRPARAAADALSELWRCSGAQFDAEIVAALGRALGGLTARGEEPPARVRSCSVSDALASPGLRAAGAVLVGFVWCASSASGQVARPDRLAVETVASVDRFALAASDRPAGLALDAFVAFRIADGIELVSQPLVKRLPNGQWIKRFYQLALRIDAPKGLPLRLEIGQMTSPFGLGALRYRADLNPTVSAPATYFLRLPPVEPGAPGIDMVDPGYPVGAQVTLGGARWDARVALVDSSPVRQRRNLTDPDRPQALQWIGGGGIVVKPGLRIGASLARGDYARRHEPGIAADRVATLVGLEGEYAFGHTKLAGEWIRGSLETATRPAVTHSWLMEATQTLSPRWFLSSRVERATLDRPAQEAGLLGFTATDVTVGYRVTPELTLRAGHVGRRRFGSASTDWQVAASAVWARRWR